MKSFDWIKDDNEKNMLEACATGKLEIVQELLKKDPSLSNYCGGAPIYLAVRSGHLLIVRLLLSYGANVAVKSGASWLDTPLQIAEDHGYHDIVGLLKEYLECTLHSNSLGQTMAELLKNRNESEIKKWIDENPEAIFSSDELGNTPLHWAVMTRQLKLIDFLLEKGANLETQRADGCKPIHLAMEGDYFYRPSRDLPKEAIQNNWFIVGYLISKGAHLDICIAAAIGDTESVRDLLTNDSGQANAKDTSGRTALFYAVKNGHEQTVNELLIHGADPNQPERDASSGAALYAAASGNHLSIASLLLAHGANPNADVSASGNPIFIAMKKGYQEMQELLYAAGGAVKLTAACALGRVDLVGEILTANHSAVNDEGDYGPLTQAVGSRYTNIVRMLLKHGVDLNRPWFASNYMCYAFRSGLDMVKLLLDHGANPNNTNWINASYLHILAYQGNTELAKVMIEYGADINAKDDFYCTTPLGWAARFGQAEMVAFLLEQGAEKTPAGVPERAMPIAWAKRRDYSAIAKML